MAATERIALTWAELLLLAVLVVGGMGIGVFIEQHVSRDLKTQEPNESAYQESESLPLRQAELASAQSELKSIQDKLSEHRVALDQQSTKVEAMMLASPALAHVPLTASRAAGITKQAFKEFQAARIELEGRTRLVKILSDQLDLAMKNVAQRTTAVSQSQRTARNRFEEAKHDFNERKQTRVLSYAACAIAVFLVAMWVLIKVALWIGQLRQGESPVSGWNVSATFILAAALLSILIAYQAFQLVGAAAAALVLVVVLFALLARSTKPPTLPNASAQP